MLRKFLSVGLNNRLFSTKTNRKLLIPAIRKIHPDVYQTESKDVQIVNLQCLQNLNELWDKVEVISNQIMSENTRSNITINNPLSSSYDLTCYMRVEHESDDSKLEKISIRVNIQSALTNRQSITSIVAKASINDIFKQLGMFCTILETENPFREIEFTIPQHSNKSNDSIDLSSLHVKLFERSLKYDKYRKYRQNILHLNVGKESRKSRKFRENMSLDVTLYLSSGNVKLRDVSTIEEIDVLSKFQDFLVQYGPYLSFDIELWSKVHIILHNSTKATLNEMTTRSSKYSCRKLKNNIYVLEIPTDFKPHVLLTYLSENLPFLDDFNGADIAF